MEKLQRRSDGIAETLSGLFAVSPTRVSAQTSDINIFTFRPTAVSDAVEVRWRKDDGIAVIEQSTARMMLDRRYAEQASDDQIARWNSLIDQLDPDAPNPVHIVSDTDDGTPPVIPEDGEGAEPAAPAATGTPAQEEAQSATESATSGVLQPAATPVAPAAPEALEPASEAVEETAKEPVEPASEDGGFFQSSEPAEPVVENGASENGSDADGSEADSKSDEDEAAPAKKSGKGKTTKGLL